MRKKLNIKITRNIASKEFIRATRTVKIYVFYRSICFFVFWGSALEKEVFSSTKKTEFEKERKKTSCPRYVTNTAANHTRHFKGIG